MALKIQIVDISKITYVFTRHIGSYTECNKAWHRLMFWVGKKIVLSKLTFWRKSAQILNDETVYFGLCYDDPDKVKDCRYDACFSVTSEVKKSIENKLPNGIQLGEIVEGKYAMTLIKGSYTTFYNVYSELYNGQTIDLNAIDFTKPSLEKYLNSPKNTKPEDLLTEIYIPLK